ncbi:hypothetical protein [Glaciihabitans sp. dw_435]|uniref:hypothetical protein n=1 Tax=Glaciihabitans sp. dw_435 TaxID=2720081 RepID=UPI001BD1EE2C|nr:hypothetical protein [Glaciihabitans sp. dw_435]
MSRTFASHADSTATSGTPPLRRFLYFFGAILLGLFLVVGGGGTGTAFAVTAPAINQCNAADAGGGTGTRCDVTVLNTLDLATGVGSSVVTVVDCHGAANFAPACPTTTTTYPQVVTSVTQCNGTGADGSTLVCNVNITNTITGVTTVGNATVNQCVGSGAGGPATPLDCNPLQSTTGATVTQCNGSVNGGGADGQVHCTVGASTVSPGLPITVNQCNGSVNGGGSTADCATTITTRVLAAVVTPVPSNTPTATPSATPSTTPSATPSATAAPTPPTSSASPTAPTPGTDTGNGTGEATPGITTDTLAETGWDNPGLLIGGLSLLLVGGILVLTRAVPKLRAGNSQK